MMTIAILSLLTLAVIVAWIVARRRQRLARAEMAPIPLFTVPEAPPERIPRPSITESGHDLSTVGEPTPRSREPSPDTRAEPFTPSSADRFAPPAATIRARDGTVSTLARAAREPRPSTSLDDEIGDPVDGRSVRFWRPADGTLQFLPGRLEVAAGHDVGQEIRFVRTPGPDGTTVTFGRADGLPYRHVQLREPTVSRAHARMTLEHPGAGSAPATRGYASSAAAQWRLENLSATNPVVVNGQPLQAEAGRGSSVILSDGDRIEMGEVAFIFHER